MEVYLDNSATTRAYDCVAELVGKVMVTDYGNPSSLHMKGVEAEQYIRYAKEIIAGNMKVLEKEIVFTSGGTESDNLALLLQTGEQDAISLPPVLNTRRLCRLCITWKNRDFRLRTFRWTVTA